MFLTGFLKRAVFPLKNFCKNNPCKRRITNVHFAIYWTFSENSLFKITLQFIIYIEIILFYIVLVPFLHHLSIKKNRNTFLRVYFLFTLILLHSLISNRHNIDFTLNKLNLNYPILCIMPFHYSWTVNRFLYCVNIIHLYYLNSSKVHQRITAYRKCHPLLYTV